MKNLFLFSALAIVLITCSSPREEPVTPPNSGIHFTVEDDFKPMSLTSEEDGYALYYADENSWHRISSSDLIHWQESMQIDIPGNSIGEIVKDENNTSGLGDASTPALIAIYARSKDIEMRFSRNNGTSWESGNIRIPPNVFGNPKVTRDLQSDQWIMSVADANTTTFLTSKNLTDWKYETDITLQAKVTTASLCRLDQTWTLLLSGGAIMSIKLDQNFQMIEPFRTMQINPGHPAVHPLTADKLVFLTNIGNRLLSLPSQLSLAQNSQLRIEKYESLANLAVTKRRSKLSSLRGQDASRFQFKIEDIDKEAELTLFNEQGEMVRIVLSDKLIQVDKTQASRAQPGELVSHPWNSQANSAEIDLLIDHGVIALTIGESTNLSFEVKPVFIYDRVSLKIGGKETDARSILYTLKKDNPSAATSI